jgi:Spy/CpxP family protein refolding chaperone
MRPFLFLLALLWAGLAMADAALDKRLGLDPAQARQLAAIEAEYRRDFASVRQDYNRESRALRRARLANDSAEVGRLTGVTEGLRQQLMALRVAQDERIVALLRPEQRPLFDHYVAERRQMVGSSRDERLFD